MVVRVALPDLLSLTRETPSSVDWSSYIAVRSNDDTIFPGGVQVQYNNGKLIIAVLGADPVYQDFGFTHTAGVTRDMEIVYDKLASTVQLYVNSKLKITKLYHTAVTAKIRPGFVGCHLGVEQIFQGGQKGRKTLEGLATSAGMNSGPFMDEECSEKLLRALSFATSSSGTLPSAG